MVPHRALETLRFKGEVEASFDKRISQLELKAGFPSMREIRVQPPFKSSPFNFLWKIVKLSPSVEELGMNAMPWLHVDPATVPSLALKTLKFLRLLHPISFRDAIPNLLIPLAGTIGFGGCKSGRAVLLPTPRYPEGLRDIIDTFILLLLPWGRRTRVFIGRHAPTHALPCRTYYGIAIVPGFRITPNPASRSVVFVPTGARSCRATAGALAHRCRRIQGYATLYADIGPGSRCGMP